MRVIELFLLALVLGGCGFFKDYSKDNEWSYFEEWDSNADFRIDKSEFAAGCLKDGFIGKIDETEATKSMFASADENQDGQLTGLEFYRWKVKM